MRKVAPSKADILWHLFICMQQSHQPTTLHRKVVIKVPAQDKLAYKLTVAVGRNPERKRGRKSPLETIQTAVEGTVQCTRVLTTIV